MKRKPSNKPQSQAAVTAEDFNWGTIFTGTKAALVKAGLMPQDCKIPKLGHVGEGYWLPLDWTERYNAACFGPDFGPIPPRWDAEVINNDGPQSLSVRASFNPDQDLNVRERAEMATIALKAALRMVEEIAPRPLSVSIPAAIKAKRK